MIPKDCKRLATRTSPLCQYDLRLANAFLALPRRAAKGSEEKRLIDAMLLAVPRSRRTR